MCTPTTAALATSSGGACGPDLRGILAVDARLTARHEEVRDLLALARPASDRAGGAVLEVVRVRDDRERALPVVREDREPGLAHIECGEPKILRTRGSK